MSQKIIEIAEDIRRGLLNGRSSPVMCFHICFALVAYLKSEHYKCVYVKGRIGSIGHCWIMLEDGNIIDPMAGTFNKPGGENMPRVYYGPKPEWYEIFPVECFKCRQKALSIQIPDGWEYVKLDNFGNWGWICPLEMCRK